MSALAIVRPPRGTASLFPLDRAEQSAGGKPEVPPAGQVFSLREFCRAGHVTWGALPTAVRRMSNLSAAAKVLYSALAEWEATTTRAEVFPSIRRLGGPYWVINGPNPAAHPRAAISRLTECRISQEREQTRPQESSFYRFLYHDIFNRAASRVLASMRVPAEMQVLARMRVGHLQECKEAYLQIKESTCRNARGVKPLRNK